MKIISNPPQATVFGRFLLSLQALSREGPVSLVLDRFLRVVRLTVTRHRKHFILLMAGSFPQLFTALILICFSGFLVLFYLLYIPRPGIYFVLSSSAGRCRLTFCFVGVRLSDNAIAAFNTLKAHSCRVYKN